MAKGKAKGTQTTQSLDSLKGGPHMGGGHGTFDTTPLILPDPTTWSPAKKGS